MGSSIDGREEEIMKIKLCLITILVGIMSATATSGSTLHAAEYNTLSTTNFNRDSTYLDTFIPAQMYTLNIPGVTACVIKDGQIIWTGAYGYADISQSIEAADTTLFMLASISKNVTGTAMMQLWENDSFDLDDNINDYLPFSVIHPLYPDSVITFDMLLTHTSGIIDRNSTLAPLFHWGGDSPIPLDTFLYNYLTPGGYYYQPNNFSSWTPGTGYSYSNVTSTLVGYLVEVITDSFPTYCYDYIFAPLEMYETSWFLAGLDTSNVAIPYQYTGGQFVPYGHWGHPIYPSFQLRTNTLQLARFLIAFMQYGEIDTVRILDSATVALMTTVHDSVLAPNQGLHWKRQTLGGRLLWGHDGATLGVGTAMWYCRDEDSGVIILTNGEPDSLTTIMHELFEYAAQHGIAENNIAPAIIAKLHVTPNPFHSNTEIRYSILDTRFSMTNPKLGIYDACGRLVRSFNLESSIENQESAISWHGDDNAGRKLPSGTYFVILKSDEYTETQKLLLVR